MKGSLWETFKVNDLETVSNIEVKNTTCY
jgi:hypothetical protein